MKKVSSSFMAQEKDKKASEKTAKSDPKVIFKRDDFLTPSKVGQQFGISTQQAQEIMQKLVFKRATFTINGHKNPIIVKMGSSSNLHLHPMALTEFKKIIDKQKD